MYVIETQRGKGHRKAYNIRIRENRGQDNEGGARGRAPRHTEQCKQFASPILNNGEVVGLQVLCRRYLRLSLVLATHRGHSG
eukprot:254657-Amorphochlora_amoeboformis.AAC.1